MTNSETVANYRARRLEQVRAANKRFRERHPERVAAYKKELLDRPEYRAWLRKWSKSPEQKAKSKARKDKARATPRGALENRIRAALQRNLRRGRGGKSWPELLGYSLDDLKLHLERQFLPGMSWENRGEWHIDHIVPVSQFEFTSSEDPEFKAAWALSNLRPLWAKDNLRKNNRRESLL